VCFCASGTSKIRRRKLITCAYGQLIRPEEEEEECLSAFIINSAVDEKVNTAKRSSPSTRKRRINVKANDGN
jgi:hypothetical protein